MTPVFGVLDALPAAGDRDVRPGAAALEVEGAPGRRHARAGGGDVGPAFERLASARLEIAGRRRRRGWIHQAIGRDGLGRLDRHAEPGQSLRQRHLGANPVDVESRQLRVDLGQVGAAATRSSTRAAGYGPPP